MTIITNEKYHYAKKFFVGYGEVDRNNKLKISSILNYFQDMATLHSKLIGFGSQEMMELGLRLATSYVENRNNKISRS